MITPRLNFNLSNLDPIRLAQIVKYRGNLTVTSNNTSIIPRDTAGNIQLREDSETNPLLIIEPVATTITLNSVLKVLDTRFQYFKFPATTRVIQTATASIDLNLGDFESDTINTELKLPLLTDDNNQIITYSKINTSYSSNWYYDSYNTSGFRDLPFTGGVQTQRPNAYTLTQSTIDQLRSKNKTLQFTIQTQFKSTTNAATALTIRLRRQSKSSRPFNIPILTTTSIGDVYPMLNMIYVLDINDMFVGDSYIIDAVAGNTSYTLNENGFWDIQVIDKPTTPALYGSNTSGVYDINGGVTLSVNENDVIREIGTKTLTNEFIYI
jgi:hypothetical protein